jgi:PEP-CTERM motif
MFKMVSTAFLTAALAFAATPATASTTLTFSTACPGVCNSFGDYVMQSYGDIAGVLDVSYRAVAAPGSTIGTGGVGYWGANYGDLNGVMVVDPNATLEIQFLLLDPTKMITLNSVDFAAWDGISRTTQMALYSPGDIGGGSALVSAAGFIVPANGHASWSPNIGALGGLFFHFGPDAFSVAVDNVTFTISDINAVTPVPEPTTWLSMMVGFGVVGAATRRRTARRAVAAI